MSPIFRRLTGFFSILILYSCGPKQAEQNIQMSANRKMAIVLKAVEPNDPEARSYYEDLLQKALRETYHPELRQLQLNDGNFLEDPENLFKISEAEIDDLFVIDIKAPSNWKPPTAPEDRELKNQIKESIASDKLELSGKIINGANLRSVSLLQTSVPWNFKTEFERDFIEAFKTAALGVFANPNIYPKSDPLHFANLLYVYSQKQERDSAVALDCQNAKEILGYYEKALQLYRRARELKAQVTMVGSQEESHELNTRLEHSREKAEVLQRCIEDETKAFELLVDYGKLDPSYQAFIQKAFETVKLEALLKKYAEKPARIVFSLDDSGNLNLTTYIRYDPVRYRAWTKDRVPQTMGTYHIVSLEPYFALMQTLVLLKYFIPASAPQPLKISFRNMNIDLVLETLLNGQLSFRVAGSYDSDEKRVQLAFPKSVYLSAPGFESKALFARSEEIFQDKGWLSFSSCRTLDGTLTEDGLLMRFLGLDCKI